MELREYIKLIKQNKYLFSILWLAVVGLAFVWYKTRPAAYDVSMSLEVTRSSVQQTSDYQYDEYYRLQADDKFADTVVQWLKDPSVVEEILSKVDVQLAPNNLKALSKTLKSEKLSSNYIQLRYSSPTTGQGEKTANATKLVIDEKIDKLNSESQSLTWFKIVYGKPIIAPASINIKYVILGSILGGFLIAIIGVLGYHYWKE